MTVGIYNYATIILMNIAVIAANGRSGQAFVKAALKAGHQIQAGVHNSSNLKPRAGLTIQACDATLEQDVLKLVEGQDAVVSFIGHVRGSPPNVQTNAIKTVISAMDKLGLKRLVSLTG
ncbi:MAG: NAD(P)H-binding protein, partial [Candidatus Saccharimonadales bacterium]